MKKTTKGAIAAGSAALLLAGGAGTMAAWSSSAALGGGTVTAGHMTIVQDPTTPGVWTWGTPGKTGTFNPGSDLIVPGDIVTYTANYKLDLAGTNLKAGLTAEAQTLGGTNGLPAVMIPGAVVVQVGGVAVTEILPGATTATVATSLTFDPATINQVGADGTASLADATVVLKQTAPAS